MMHSSLMRKLVVGVASIVAIVSPVVAHAAVSIGISVGFAPPPLPVYAQPICPGDGYLWNPGYWAYGDAGYYWVPGVWVQPPSVGLLWTPPYWGFAGGVYGFHTGYWGPHVGFYGGVNYGFGFGGVGFVGGRWDGGHFAYNTAINNVNTTVIHNTYVDKTVIVNNNNSVHTSFNGGPGGIQARPTPQQAAFEHENHIPPTAAQQGHYQAAQQNRANFASANGGHPQIAAASTPQAFRNQVNARQANQQGRINQGVRSGQLTPGETRNVENRDSSIHNQVQADRQANGGALTQQERQQVNQRQNNVNQSINNDKHNANNDAAAAARNNRAPQGEQRQAERVEHNDHPKR